MLSALRQFVEHVAKLHPGRPPILYGNCQAGWAATLVSAHCEGLTGPAVLNGSPLSYWAGEAGVNPMRVAAGFVGGVWLTHYLSDLGLGRFDGAWLAQNFEGLKPETAVRDKYANLFTHVDIVLAAAVAKDRRALPEDHPLIAQERRLIAQISSFWQIARRLRDASIERIFALTYGAATDASNRKQQEK